MLARRDYSQHEIRDKLASKTSQPELIDEILNELTARNWQSDTRFTENFVSFRAAKGVGPLKILQELHLKGIDETQAKAMIYGEQYDWHAKALTALVKKFKQKENDQLKQKRFLLSRGFPYDIIHDVVNAFAQQR